MSGYRISFEYLLTETILGIEVDQSAPECYSADIEVKVKVMISNIKYIMVNKKRLSSVLSALQDGKLTTV